MWALRAVRAWVGAAVPMTARMLAILTKLPMCLLQQWGLLSSLCSARLPPGNAQHLLWGS